jgi:hypothetical protein
MSLADLVPVILQTRMKLPAQDRDVVQRRWQIKNREHLRRYKKAYDAQRRAK